METRSSSRGVKKIEIENCLMCKKPCKQIFSQKGDNSVLCYFCNKWCHFRCSGIPPERYTEFDEKEYYTCQLCLPIIAIPIPLTDEEQRKWIADTFEEEFKKSDGKKKKSRKKNKNRKSCA